MRIVFAANNGDIGGGEVMLLALAREAEYLGHDVLVVGPDNPDSLMIEAHSRGISTELLPSRGRIGYMTSLRRWWGKQDTGLLWCNGLLPAVATSGMDNRVVHLHQVPSARLKRLLPLARRNALLTLVPSSHMLSAVAGDDVLSNWSEKIEKIDSSIDESSIRIGFIGRFSSDKGLPTLIEALNKIKPDAQKRMRLVLAGEPKFVGKKDRRIVTDAIERSNVPVEQIGWATPSAFFSAVDFVVVPSVWQEPFGLVATETMSARVPLIVSDAGALPQIVGQEHPWIARAGDSDDLMRVISMALQASEEQRQLIVDRGYRRWESTYSPPAGRTALDELLKSIEGK